MADWCVCPSSHQFVNKYCLKKVLCNNTRVFIKIIHQVLLLDFEFLPQEIRN